MQNESRSKLKKFVALRAEQEQLESYKSEGCLTEFFKTDMARLSASEGSRKRPQTSLYQNKPKRPKIKQSTSSSDNEDDEGFEIPGQLNPPVESQCIVEFDPDKVGVSIVKSESPKSCDPVDLSNLNYCSEDEETPERSQNLNCEMITSQEPPLIPTIYRAKLGRPPKNSTEIQYSSSNPNQTNQQNWTYENSEDGQSEPEFDLSSHFLNETRDTKSSDSLDLNNLVKEVQDSKKQVGINIRSIYKCVICQTVVPDSEIKTHVQNHTEEETDACFVCRLCFSNFTKETFLKHKTTAHVTVELADRTCSVCGKVCRDKSRCEEHERTHSISKPFCCGICNAAFTRKDSVKRHLKRSHHMSGLS